MTTANGVPVRMHLRDVLMLGFGGRIQAELGVVEVQLAVVARQREVRPHGYRVSPLRTRKVALMP